MKSSTDKSEIEKFSNFSYDWWNPTGTFKMLHEINPVRLKYITQKIKEHFGNNKLSSINILDVGCGGGLVTVPLCQMGANVTGIDASLTNIEAAKDYAKTQRLDINYLNLGVEELTAQKKQYDIVLCLEVIEHVANIENFIQNLTKLVAPCGMLICSTINRNIKSFFQAIVMAEYILGWVPKKTHSHSKFVKPSELNSLLRLNNMHLQELQGLAFELTSQSWVLTPNIDVNYFAYSIKI